ncbi:hypothetical protein [Pollutimonas bauzanensis]|uniref:hypothetical protein n=1 Tax=Pollutimonas bauzanensis TaxID=658167 RepID=UPI003340FA5D
MKVTTTKTTPRASKTAQTPQEKRFDQAWQRVIEQQKENDSFRENIHAFSRDIHARIQDGEQAYMDAMHGACLHLLSFFNRRSLAQWQRETLMDWVTEYLETMQTNPFSCLDTEPIRQRLAQAMAATFPDSVSASGYPADDLSFGEYGSPTADEEDPFIEDMFQEWMAEFEETKTGGSGEEQDEAYTNQEFAHGFFEEQRAHEQQRLDESLALKHLMKSSSVNKLFRKVAGTLHPDKERDEAARQEKNRLMGELIQARNTNDIPRIFAFYAEYVGQSPLQELGKDLLSVTELLERQYLYLRELKERILDEDPLTGILYRRFHRKTPAATQRAINKHLKETQAHANALRAVPQDITSLNRLKPYLELRYEMLIQDSLFDI